LMRAEYIPIISPKHESVRMEDRQIERNQVDL
jgi:hypothetical protein